MLLSDEKMIAEVLALPDGGDPLDRQAENLKRTYDIAKEWEKKLRHERAEFFRAIEERASEYGLLDQKEIVIIASDEDALLEICDKKHPEYDVHIYDEHVPGEWRVILRRNPKYVDYTVETDNVKVRRQIVEGDIMLDDERLQNEDPALWKTITRPIRELVDMDELSEDIREELREYLYQGKPRVKLLPPKENDDKKA